MQLEKQFFFSYNCEASNWRLYASMTVCFMPDGGNNIS